ncbi:MAG: DUF2220 family protein [Defluviitaleaceae bacterium]|nr:DUF2220 family protein [Defluviitaleaceae bacterium]MCL2273870.1 DUF2220 family protein [Defluviitaleaceae bacterium]
MTSWTNVNGVKSILQKKWESGRILTSLFLQDDFFPLSIPLKKPTNAEIGIHFMQVDQWKTTMVNESKAVKKFGYELREQEIVNRQSGRNFIPTHAIIPTVEDGLWLIGKKKEARHFIQSAQTILTKRPELHDWIGRYPFKVLQFADEWTKLLLVLEWLCLNRNSGLYVRQIDLPGVDTKFIERREKILAELMTILLPEMNSNIETYTQRFGLCAKPAQVRLRILDKHLYLHGFSDIAIPVEQLAANPLIASRVFITENEINGLCFPDMKDSIVIFGLGYAVDILKTVTWLREREIYYWGDLDTHGFAMLNQVRTFLPHTKRFLMDEDILFAHKNLWGHEKKTFVGTLSHLDEGEQSLFSALKENHWGENIRLEQELISFAWVKREIDSLTTAYRRSRLAYAL